MSSIGASQAARVIAWPGGVNPDLEGDASVANNLLDLAAPTVGSLISSAGGDRPFATAAEAFAGGVEGGIGTTGAGAQRRAGCLAGSDLVERRDGGEDVEGRERDGKGGAGEGDIGHGGLGACLRAGGVQDEMGPCCLWWEGVTPGLGRGRPLEDQRVSGAGRSARAKIGTPGPRVTEDTPRDPKPSGAARTNWTRSIRASRPP